MAQKRVILEADPALQNSLDSLKDIYLPSSVGSTPVPLSVLSKMLEELEVGPDPNGMANLQAYQSTPRQVISGSSVL